MILVGVAVTSAFDDNTQFFYDFSWCGVTSACDDNTQLVFYDFSCGSGCDQCL